MATTEAEKLALAAFKEIEEALETRRLSIDAADKTFRDSLYQRALSKKVAQDEAVEATRTSMESALREATTACASGVDSKKIRSHFLREMLKIRKTN